MRTKAVLFGVIALCSSAVLASMPEGKRLCLRYISEHRLVAADEFKGVDNYVGRGVLKEITVTREPSGRIVVSGVVISENTGSCRQGSFVFLGDTTRKNLVLYAVSDCDGGFRFAVSPKQLSQNLYLGERVPYRLIEYTLPEAGAGHQKKGNPNTGMEGDE
jgi:hypothetical protein